MLLALAVVFAHTSIQDVMTGGAVAVQAFYITSGFYMALILDTTYRSAAPFYVNRLLRLFPTYWTVAILTLLAFMIARQEYFFAFAALAPSAKAILATSNVILFGQDLVMFMGTDGHRIYITSDFEASAPPLHHFLLVPQAWTLGLELTFYAIAPIVLRWRTRYLVVMFIGSIAFRLVMYRLGLRHDPWTYRFFPFEIALFLAGSMAYRAYRINRERLMAAPRGVLWLAPVWLWIFVLFFPVFPGPVPARAIAFYVCVAALLPMVFEITRRCSWDRAIGELSYPTYIVHVLVLGALAVVLKSWPLLSSGWPGAILGCCATLVAAAVLHIVVERPIERVRQKRKASGLPQNSRPCGTASVEIVPAPKP